MKIGFTATTLQGGKTGVARYIIRLLDAFRQLDGGPAVDLVAKPAESHLLPGGRTDWSLHTLPEWLRGAVWDVAWHQMRLGRMARRHGWDLLHVPTLRRLPARSPCPVVVTVHDLAAFHVTDKYDLMRSVYNRRVLPRMLANVEAIITPSSATKQDIVSLLGVDPERITVIFQGIDHDQFRPGPRDEARQALLPELRLPSEFLLYVARLEHPGKNHVRLLEALAELRRGGLDIPLVLAGAAWHGAEAIYEAVNRLRLQDRVIFGGFVPDEKLPDLYRAATAFVFPSLFEGFGFPPLEAMACGTPVVCANVSSLPEVAGDAAEMVDPLSSEDIARGVRAVLESADWSAELVRRGRQRAGEFHWQRTARETLAVYDTHKRRN